MSPANTMTVHHARYPVFSVRCRETAVDTRKKKEALVLLAGGGGDAAMGIPNAVESLYFGGSSVRSGQMHETGKNCAWVVAVHPFKNILAVGLGEFVQFVDCGDDGSSFINLSKIQTEETEDTVQKVVRFNKTGDVLLTAGEEGVVRLWRFQATASSPAHRYRGSSSSPAKSRGVSSAQRLNAVSANKMQEHKWHKGIVYDADIHPDSSLVVSCGADKQCIVWAPKASDSSKQVLEPRPLTDKGLYFRGCRFSKSGRSVFTLQTKPRGETFITKWGKVQDRWEERATVLAYPSPATAFELNPQGTLLAVGTSDCSVVLFSATDLARRYEFKEIHGLPVTSMSFTADSSHVVSVSADRSVQFLGLEFARQGDRGLLALVICVSVCLFVFYYMLMFGADSDL